VKLLTWHPGTILPYASLWHTLMRATWLNDLRAGDIRDMVERERRRQGESLFNYRGEPDVRAVASALGEPRRALSTFAVIDGFPLCVRTIFMANDARWCPTCVASGFHTLLGSIRLLTRCPIHRIRFLEACPGCGDAFTMQLGGLAVRPRVCRCGSMRWLTPQSARQPSLSDEDAAAWGPVARWVREVRNVVYSASPSSRLPPQTHLALARRWCSDLGIHYPDCFDDLAAMSTDADEPKRWSKYMAVSGDLLRGQPADRHEMGRSSPPPAQVAVYRAMGRHLRRHGLSHPDQWIKALMSTHDRATCAITMAARPQARIAFTEMLWSRLLEPRAVIHRWPNRPMGINTTPGTSPASGTPIELHEGLGRIAPGPVMSAEAQCWVVCHAMAIEALQAWACAWQRTQTAITNEWAEWPIEEKIMFDEQPYGPIVWFCRLRSHRMEFVGYIRDAFMVVPFSAAAPVAICYLSTPRGTIEP
jgi:hypothetical protein